MGKMNSRVVLSLVFLLVATSVLFTATAATSAAASYCTWDPLTKQNVCVSELGELTPSGFSHPTASQPTSQLLNCPNYHVPTSKPPISQLPNCPNYPNYSNYPNCPNYPNYSNYPNCPGYPYYSNYVNYPYYSNYATYPYYYSNPSYGYGAATTVQTVTATSYSFVTQTSEVTSIAPPVTVTARATVTTTSTTSDTTAETLYGTLMAVFLALFLATLVLLVGSRYRGSKGSNPQSSQAPSARPAQAYIATSYKCSACGTDVGLSAKFCGKCGAALRR